MPDTRTERLRAALPLRATPLSIVVLAAVLAFGTGAVAQQSAGRPGATAASAPGFDVAAVQRKLGVPADGVIGPRTRRAVKRFQRREGLTVDGVIGPQTLRALGVGRLTSRPSVPAAEAPSAAAARTTAPTARLRRIAQCESGGDPTAVSADGLYRGKYQFSRATWRALGGRGDPAAAPEAEQDRLAALLMRRQGPGAWPSCAR